MRSNRYHFGAVEAPVMAQFLLGIGIPLLMFLGCVMVLHHWRHELPRWLRPIAHPSKTRNAALALIVVLAIVRWWLQR